MAVPTKKDIEKYLSLEERRKALQREARALEAEAEPLETLMLEFVRAKGGDARSVERSGFVLAIGTRAGTVRWKDEFVRECGNKKAEALIEAAPPREFLSVEAKR